ncbi:gluconate:H+ symporter [Kineosporia sp. NBRC 101731]|uniref:GntT/GntP/DsdX family permease n=1 Tax=Kineosporia sp. NBRC 101731 TaxID=3032199 RepID=UPI0024A0FDF0|nr:gluconate:H+ symporter [Kineosporia sp. NBRC 101731]GLY30704.1 gluconate transporter [Kineosporia sp. NBRC 101731]
MSSEIVSLLWAFAAVVVLILMITRAKLNPFLALSITAIALGLVNGLTPGEVIDAFKDGVGAILGGTAPTIGLGVILGSLLLGSGGADKIVDSFLGQRPVAWIPSLICVAAVIIGLPHLFDVSFVMLAPLVYTVARRRNVHLLWVGLPLASGLYVSHGLLPPHPSPTAAVSAYGANTGLTIAYGLIIAVPTAIVCGPLFTRFARRWFGPAPDLDGGPAPVTDVEPERPGHPVSLALSLISVLMPPVLMLIGTIGTANTAEGTAPYNVFEAFNDSIISLLVAVVFAFFALGRRSGFSAGQLQKMSGKGLAAVGPIILILGAGGALKQMFTATGVDAIIADHAGSWSIPAVVLAWVVAALLRICLGSATVATTAATGIVAPLLAADPTLSPELLVLATASGSVMLSHVNDSGFWLFKEYYQLSVKQTFRTWTLMLSIQSLIGLAGVVVLSAVI